MLAQHGGDRIAGYDPQHDENNQDNAYEDRYGYQDSFQTFFKHWITPFFLLGVLSETTLQGKEVSEGTPHICQRCRSICGTQASRHMPD